MELNNLIYNSIEWNKIYSNEFNQDVEDVYIENYIALMKEIRVDINKWKDILCSWIGS